MAGRSVPEHAPEVWLGFTGLVVVLLVLDLGVLNRRSHVLSLKEAMSWTAGIVLTALLFGAGCSCGRGGRPRWSISPAT